MYMSYCRFEGTLHELRACMADVGEHVNEEAEYKVSDSEIRCFRTMVEEVIEFLQEHELIDENGYLDEDSLDWTCKKMAESWEDEYE